MVYICMINENKKIINRAMCPNFEEEKKLWRRGYKFVAGIDEAGRGPLAGPVVAAAVVIMRHKEKFQETDFLKNNNFWNIKDSKELLPKKRNDLFQILTKSSVIKWGIGRVSEKVIDKINILEATKLAMEKATKNLEKKLSPFLCGRTKKGIIDFLIIDGNFSIDLDIPQKSVIMGDKKVFLISAASIIAKVSRDKIMSKYDKKYPEYGFAKHKGYGTKFHQDALKRYGPCEIHRKTFNPIKNL